MMRIGLIVFGVICFIGFAIAAAPARLAFDLALKPAGVEAGLVQGSVWDARLWRIRAGDQSIASARAALDALSLIAFIARFDITLTDEGLRADGAAILAPAGVRLEETSGVVRLSRVMPQLAAFAPDEAARFDITALSLDRQGRCQSAEGRVFTPVLITLGERYGASLPMLEGDLFCVGDAVGLRLTGASDSLSVDGRLRFISGGLEGRIEARSTELPVVAALSFAGFDQTGEGVYALTVAQEGED